MRCHAFPLFLVKQKYAGPQIIEKWKRDHGSTALCLCVRTWEEWSRKARDVCSFFFSTSDGAPIIKDYGRKTLIWELIPKDTGKLVRACAWRGASWEVWLNVASWLKVAEKQRAQQGPSVDFVSLLSGTAPAQGASWVTSLLLVFSKIACNK